MKKIIFTVMVVCFSLNLQAETPNGKLQNIRGFVEEVYIGEVDPFVVGDACVAFVRNTSDNVLYGLIELGGLCESDVDLQGHLVGKYVSVAVNRLNYVKSEQADVLRNDLKRDAYYLEIDHVLALNVLKVKLDSGLEGSFKSLSLNIFKSIGDYIVGYEMGGNAGSSTAHRLKYSDGRLTEAEVIRAVVFLADGAEYLNTQSGKAGRITSMAEFATAVESLLDDGPIDEPWEDERVNFKKMLRSGYKAFEDNLVFFEGYLDGAFDYSAAYLAILDRNTREIIIIAQGYAE